MNRARLIRFWLYAVTGVLAVALVAFLVFEWQVALDLWSRTVNWVEVRWRRGLSARGAQFVLATVLLMVMELFFLNWEKTTVFMLFVRRS